MRKFLTLRTQKGFTLIEVMLAMTISLIGLAAGVAIFTMGNKYFYVEKNFAEVHQQARMAIETMVKELQRASASTIIPSLNDISGQENSTGIIIFASAAGPISYFRDANSNILYKTSFAGQEPMATSVNSVEFWSSGNNNSLLNIKITIALDFGAENPSEVELTTIIKPRN
jgi:prepilin-type N-terminal cleavage/methylation domain-containing protein